MAGHASEKERKFKLRVSKERKRLDGLVRRAGMTAEAMELHGPTLDNLAWLKEKLSDARVEIGASEFTVEYNNGKQWFTHKNPALDAYEGLWKAYLSGFAVISDALPEGELAPDPKLNPENVLELVRARRAGA